MTQSRQQRLAKAKQGASSSGRGGASSSVGDCPLNCSLDIAVMTEADRKPVAKAKVTVDGKGTKDTDADGFATWDPLPAGVYKVTIEHDGARQEHDVTVRARDDFEPFFVGGPTVTKVFLKWDGICFPDPKTGPATLWRNAAAVGAGRATSPTPPSDHAPNTDPATVAVVQVDEFFAPTEEWMVVGLSITNIHRVGCLVLQIRDVEGTLVYAERLSQKQVWGLPTSAAGCDTAAPPFAIRSEQDAATISTRRAERAKHPWASAVGGPYQVAALLTETVTAQPDQLVGTPALDADPAGLQTDSGAVVKNTVDGGTPPKSRACGTDASSVQLTGEVAVELCPWPEVYMAATGDGHYPVKHGEIDVLPADKKLLWVKCRLNEIGYHAGPITSKADDPDFQKAIRRYGTMRAIGGKVHYFVDTTDPNAQGLKAPQLLDRPVDERTVWPRGSPLPKYDALKVLGTGFTLDALAEHLKREVKLVESPITHADQLCAPADAQKPLRLIVECNRYFAEGDEGNYFSKFEIERDWLSRPWLPLRCVAPVRFKQGEPAPVLEALHDLRVSWSWQDAAEDPALLIDPDQVAGDEASQYAYRGECATVYGKPAVRTKARPYLAATRQRVSTKLGACGFDHNARAELGGTLVAAAKDNATKPFQAMLAMGKAAPAATDFVAVDEASLKGVVGRGPVVYFGASTIAGDRYVFTAKVELARQRDRGGAVIGKPRQDGLGKLWKSMKVRSVVTTPLTLWRRLRVAAFVEWPARTQAWDKSSYDLDTILKAMQAEYAMAYTEIVPSKPGQKSLNRMTPSQVALLDADFDDVGGHILKYSGLKAPMRSIEEHVVRFLGSDKALEFRGGRALYDDSGALDTAAFSNAALLPRLQTYRMAVTAGDPFVAMPADGVVPSTSRILAFLFSNKLKSLLGKAKAGTLTFEEQGVLADLWLLFEDWQSCAGVGDAFEQVRRAGRAMCTLLDNLMDRTPAFGPRLKLDRSSKKVPATDALFTWKNTPDPNPQKKPIPDPIIADTPELRVDYGQQNFPQLMTELLLPMGRAFGSVRTELEAWLGRRSLEAIRAASIFSYLSYLNLTQRPDAMPDMFVYFAYEHFKAWYGDNLELDGRKKPTGVWKDLPSARRSVTPFVKTCAYMESQILEPLQGNSAGLLLDLLSTTCDRVLRKGIQCRRDTDENYQELADGMVIMDALVAKTMKLGTEDYDVSGTSKGCPLGLVFVSHATAMESYALYAHEVAHVLHMDHWQNAPGLAFDHDRSDQNCMMTYPLVGMKSITSLANLSEGNQQMINAEIASYSPKWAPAREVIQKKEPFTRVEVANILDHTPSALFRPHFCGKCNLKVRGWDLYAKAADEFLLPDCSGADLADEYPFAAVPLPAPAGPVFVKPEVYLIAGTVADDAPMGAPLDSIGVSFYPSDKAGTLTAGENAFKLANLKPFCPEARFDADSAQDQAAFRVEVHDPNRAAARVFVHLEAKKPVYEGRTVKSWVPFPDPERANRALVNVECLPLATDANRYRSRYIRLVTDEEDQKALASTKQGLLVTDCADGLGTANDGVEILDQQVCVIYDPMQG